MMMLVVLMMLWPRFLLLERYGNRKGYPVGWKNFEIEIWIDLCLESVRTVRGFVDPINLILTAAGSAWLGEKVKG